MKKMHIMNNYSNKLKLVADKLATLARKVTKDPRSRNSTGFALTAIVAIAGFALCQTVTTDEDAAKVAQTSRLPKRVKAETPPMAAELLDMLNLRATSEYTDGPEEESISEEDGTSALSKGAGKGVRRLRIRFTDGISGCRRTVLRCPNTKDRESSCPQAPTTGPGFRFSTQNIGSQIKNADPNTFYIDPQNYRKLGLTAGPCTVRVGTEKTFAGAIFGVPRPGDRVGCGSSKMTASWWDGGLRGWYVTELPKKASGTVEVSFDYILTKFTPEKSGSLPTLEPVFYTRKGTSPTIDRGVIAPSGNCANRKPFKGSFPIPEDATHFVIKPGFDGKDKGQLTVWNLTVKTSNGETPALPAPPAPTTGMPGGDEDLIGDADAEAEVLRLTNDARSKEGLMPLSADPDLTRAARYHAKDMEEDNYFSHDTQDRQNGELSFVCDAFTRMQKFDSNPNAENIAKDQASAQEVMAAWLNSPGHRSNILSPTAKRLGVGKVGGTWVQDFGG